MPANPVSDDDVLDKFPGPFNAVTLQRGRAYAAEGRVRIKRVERAPGEIRVEAEVQGTRKRPYEVDLWLEVDKGGAAVDVDNVCMCPMQENCKHVVAVLVTFGQTTDIGSLAGHVDARPRQEAEYPEPSAATLEWLGSLDEPATPKLSARTSQGRVVYLLRPGGPPSPRNPSSPSAWPRRRSGAPARGRATRDVLLPPRWARSVQ